MQDMKAMSDKVRHASVNTSVHSRASMTSAGHEGNV